MIGTRRWKNVKGWVSVEVFVNDNGDICEFEGNKLFENNDAVNSKLKPMIGKKGSELVVYFTSTGSYTPMSMYGGKDNLGWPEEFDDERLYHSATLDSKELDYDLGNLLFDKFYDKILDEQDLDWDDYCE